MDNEIENLNKHNIIPDAASIYEALRSSGYDNVSAIADLVDNSIDAGASNIYLQIESVNYGGSIEITLADDGCGMDSETIRQAIRLGGKKDHSTSEDLGKFGLGLITASISIGRKITIISRKNGKTLTAICDLDTIQETNTFYADIYESTPEEEETFNSATKNSAKGTVVKIGKCDRVQFDSVESFVRNTKETLRRIFRSFMKKSSKKIFVNNNELEYDDPLWLDDEDTKIILPETEFSFDSNGTKKKMTIMIVMVPDKGVLMNRKLGFNQQNQGFYLMRNNREIAAGVEFPEIFKKHNDYNRMRIEWSFNADLDDDMNINFLKHNASPSALLLNKVKEVVEDKIIEVRKIAKESQKGGKPIPPKPNPSPAGKTPITPTPAPIPNPVPVSAPGLPTNGRKDPQNIDKPSTENVPVSDINISFLSRFASENEPLFEVTQTNNSLNILYNASSPLFKKMIIEDANLGENKHFLDNILRETVLSCISNNLSIENTINIMTTIAKQIVKEI